MDYKGYEIVQFVDDNEMIEFYRDPKRNLFNLNQNEYAMVRDPSGRMIDKLKWNGKQCVQVKYIPVKNDYSGKIVPRNDEQELAFDLLQDRNSTVKLLTGTWGSGKTMLMAAHAVNEVLKNRAEKIVWIRNNFVTRDSKDIGYLPGDFTQKMIVWAAPLADHLGGEDGLRQAMDNGMVEIQHLGFIRGRDIKNAIVLCSEAENLTRAHMALLLSRIGEGSQLWLDGDTAQTDHQRFDIDSGIHAVIEALRGDPLFGYVELQKTERSPTAELAGKLL